MYINSGSLKAAVAAVTLSLILLPASGPALADEAASAKGVSVADNTSEYFRDYLSDPRRTGSLAGSIIGGALSAHPAGPIVGGLVGFLVGKQSMFNEDKVKAQRESLLYARRDIVPPGGAESVPILSFASAQGVTFDTPPAGSGLAGSQAAPKLASFSREQIAAMCVGGVLADPRMRALCFYSQGG